MNCSECTTQISEYLDGELPNFNNRLVKKHLQSCLSCQDLANDLLALNSEIEQAMNSISVPTYLEERILTSIRKEHRKARVRVGLTGLTFILLGIPILSLFSPFLLSSLRLFYKTISVFMHTWLTLITLIVPPVLVLEITVVVALLIALGVYCLRVLLRGFHVNEVLS